GRALVRGGGVHGGAGGPAVGPQQGGEGAQARVEVGDPVEGGVEGLQGADRAGADGVGGLGGGEEIGGHGPDRTTTGCGPVRARRSPLSALGDHLGRVSVLAGSLGRHRRSRSSHRVRRPAGPCFPYEGRMDRKSNTVFRNVAIAGVIILVILGFSFFANDERGYTEVDTSVALAQVDADNVKEALIEDREQRLRLELSSPITPAEGEDETDKILTKYPERAADQIFDRVAAAEPETYNTEVTQQGFLMQMASFLLP